MKSSDRTILIGVAMLGLVAAFWFLILSPKRQEASDLKDAGASLESEVADAEAAAAAGEAGQARLPVATTASWSPSARRCRSTPTLPAC